MRTGKRDGIAHDHRPPAPRQTCDGMVGARRKSANFAEFCPGAIALEWISAIAYLPRRFLSRMPTMINEKAARRGM
jgi:hypothetical protein